MSAFRRRLAALGAAAAAVPVLAALPIGTASAAAKTVNVGSTAFTPSSLTIAPKDSVAFKNVTGTVISLSFSSNWPSPNPETLTPGATSTRRTLTAVGTYTATATGVGVSSSGKVIVKKPVVTSTGTPKPSPTARTTPPTTTARASATPPATSTPAQPTPSSGTASGPVIGPTFSAGPQPSGSTGPQPSVAPPPSNDPPALAGGSKTALLQPHAIRRLGLPGALSAVLVLGLLFGLGRVLLAMAPRRPQAD